MPVSRAPFIVFEVDDGLAVVGSNERAERLLGRSRDAVIGRTLAELLPVAGGADTWRRLLADGGDVPQVVAVELPQQGRRDLELFVAPASAEGPAALYAHDVTGRVARERRTRLETAVLDAIKSSLDVGVWAVDRQGTALYHEGKGNKTSGIDGFVGHNFFELFGDTPGNKLLRLALAGEPQHMAPEEYNGLVWESWCVPVDDPVSGAAAVGISLNVTESKRREDDLRAQLDLVAQQREVIRELSTPVIEVWDGILTLPIVGLVDSVRTAEIMDSLLQTVVRTKSRFAILDLTGVQVVDTNTASHLIGLIQAIRLLGAEGVLTGIHPNIAQTVVAIGVDLTRVRVFAKLRDALKYCLAQTSARA